MNEFIFLVLLISLIILNTEQDWTVSIAYIYMQVIVMNSVLDFLIIQVFNLRNVWIWIRNRLKKPRTVTPATSRTTDQIHSIEVMNQEQTVRKIDSNSNNELEQIFEESKEQKNDFKRDEMLLQDIEEADGYNSK